MIRKLIIGLIPVILVCCTEDEPEIFNEELIFTHSYPIPVPEYSYTDQQGNDWHILGDDNEAGYPDTVSVNPVFLWEDFGINIITIAIFTSPVEVRNGNIVNTDDIIWQWHNGLETEKADTVQYTDGKIVDDGEIDYNSIASTLATGNYFWAIWGWGRSGIKVLYSSREFEFYVLN